MPLICIASKLHDHFANRVLGGTSCSVGPPIITNEARCRSELMVSLFFLQITFWGHFATGVSFDICKKDKMEGSRQGKSSRTGEESCGTSQERVRKRETQGAFLWGWGRCRWLLALLYAAAYLLHNMEAYWMSHPCEIGLVFGLKVN